MTCVFGVATAAGRCSDSSASKIPSHTLTAGAVRKTESIKKKTSCHGTLGSLDGWRGGQQCDGKKEPVIKPAARKSDAEKAATFESHFFRDGTHPVSCAWYHTMVITRRQRDSVTPIVRVQPVIRSIIGCLLVSLFAANLHAAEPTVPVLEAAIQRGNLTVFLSDATTWLQAQAPPVIDEASLATLLNNKPFITTLDQRQLVSLTGAAP